MRNSTRPKRRFLRSNRCGQQRKGAAAVECAFCIPLIMLIMFGTLETCSGIFLKETVTVAAYEGARVGVRRRAKNSDVKAQCQAVLQSRNITGATVTVSPDDFSALNALDPITVTVTAPTAGNSLYVFDFMTGRSVTGQVIMVREFDE